MKKFKDYLMIIESQQESSIDNIIKKIENKKIITKVSELDVEDDINENKDVKILENLSDEFDKIIKNFNHSQYENISNIINKITPLLEQMLEDPNFILISIIRQIFFTLYQHNQNNKEYRFNQWNFLEKNPMIDKKIDSYDF